MVSLENNGGFASVRSSPVRENLTGFTAFVLRVRGDGRSYKFSVRTGAGFDTPLYQCSFTTRQGEWEEHRLAFSDFVPTFRGRVLTDVLPLNPAKVNSVGLLISDKQAGPFRLEIGWIKAAPRARQVSINILVTGACGSIGGTLVSRLANRGHRLTAFGYASGSVIEQECEAILLSIGKRQEAYSRYAFSANRRGTGVATFHALSEKYPEKDPKEILDDLIRLSPGSEGKWFATARQLGFLDLAVKLALTSPCEPRTLNLAAKDLLAENPSAALAIAMSSLRWMREGAAYELSGIDVYSACSSTMKAADTAGQGDKTAGQIARLTRHHPFVYDFCRQVDPRIARADSGVWKPLMRQSRASRSNCPGVFRNTFTPQ